MGYYTDYTLNIDNPIDLIAFAEKFEKVTGYDFTSLANIKWYSHNHDMELLSKQYPNNIFTLYGDGEDGDHWVHYFWNGQIQGGEAKIVYPQLDYSKFKGLIENNPELLI